MTIEKFFMICYPVTMSLAKEKIGYQHLLLLFLLGVLPFLDGGTDTVSTFLIGLICLFLAIFFWLKRREKLPFLPILAWLAFLLFVSLSTLSSISLAHSLPQLTRHFFYFLFFIGVYLAAKTLPNFVEWLAGIIILASVGLTIISFYYLYAFPRFGPPGISTMNLVYASFGHNHLSDYLLFSLPLVLVLALTAKKRKIQLLFVSILGFLLAGFISTFARGAFFVIIPILIFILAWVKIRVSIKKKWLVFVAVVFPATALLLILTLSFLTSFPSFQRFQLRIPNIFIRQLFKPIILEPRFSYWQQAIQTFRESPFLGTGLDTFRFASFRLQKEPLSWCWFTTNHFLQMFAETGIFGGIAFLFLIGSILALVYKRVGEKKEPILIGLFGALLASTLHSFLDWDWQFPAVFLTFWAISAVLLGKKIKQVKVKFLGFLPPLLAILLSLFFTASTLADFYSIKGTEEAYLLTQKIYSFKIESYQKLALIYREEEKFEKALKVLKDGLRLDPPNGFLHRQLADVLVETGKYQEAEKEMKLAIAANPLDKPDFYLDLAKIYKVRGKDEEEALLLFIDHSWEVKDFNLVARKAGKVYFALTELYFNRGDEERGFAIFEKLVRDIAWSFPYHQKLGILEKAQKLFDRGKREEARQLLERYAQTIEGLEFEDFGIAHHYVGETLKLLSQIYFLEEEKDKGIAALEKTIEADPWVSEYYLELGKELIKKGKTVEAGEVYWKCLEFFPENVFCRRALESIPSERS